ncbi:MAG: hypothetical protein ACLP01_30705 [Solirubrobacteraceae bacterium]
MGARLHQAGRDVLLIARSSSRRDRSPRLDARDPS